MQSCSNNPTGVDPSADQWAVLFDIVQERKLLPFLDCAYQGFARWDELFAVWSATFTVGPSGARVLTNTR
jgi:aspartate/tyrosine/aromatic aminotransferase